MTRNEMIIEDRKNKMQYEQIAEKYGLSEDYVRKICGSKNRRRFGGVLQKEIRPTGVWIKNEHGWYYHCSVCKEDNLLHTDEANALSNYCPHCGAEMENKEE